MKSEIATPHVKSAGSQTMSEGGGRLQFLIKSTNREKTAKVETGSGKSHQLRI